MATWSKKRLKAISDKYGTNCFYCKGDASEGTYKGFHIDHVIPRSKGGGNNIENTVPACLMCNSFKCDMTVDEWKGLIRYKLAKLKSEYVKNYEIYKKLEEISL